MKFALLITSDESQFATMSNEELAVIAEKHRRFVAEIASSKKLVAGERLAQDTNATRVRVRRGQPTFTDGPFVETKETLGGFYIIDCASREEAIAWAERCPSAEYGTVEVRPIVDPL